MTRCSKILRSETVPSKQEMFLLFGLPEPRPAASRRRGDAEEFPVLNICQLWNDIVTYRETAVGAVKAYSAPPEGISLET